jgi:formylglycine-generating enzyme required for sulfatase activity
MRASGGGVEEPVALSQVLFPRSWRSPAGMHKRRRFIGSAVPWEDCPVFGITFFEAVAYAAWLSAVTGKPVTLPDEAQYERAASWPVTAPPGRGGKAGRSSRQAAAKPLLLDPGRKLLFPWQDHCPHDFNHFFGREGRGVEDYYQKDRELYARLLRSTSRRLGAKGAPGGEGEEGGAVEIHQLEGFGWHWTRDRYNETERKYSRFEDPDYPLFTAAPCATSDGTRVKVRHYVANRSPRDPLFVLKGSPDVVGGPGTTTRRYAVYPLRGYTNVGFRLVCQKK